MSTNYAIIPFAHGDFLTPFSNSDPMKFVFEQFKPSSIYSPKKPLRVFFIISTALSETANAFAKLHENEKFFHLVDQPNVENFILQKTKFNFSKYFTTLQKDQIQVLKRSILHFKKPLSNDSLKNHGCNTAVEAVAFLNNKFITQKEKKTELNFIDFPDLTDDDLADALENAKKNQIEVSSLLISSPAISKIPDCDQLEILALQNITEPMIFPKNLPRLRWLILNGSEVNINGVGLPKIRRLSTLSSEISYSKTFLEKIECRDVFDAMIEWEPKIFPKLVSLRITDCNIQTLPKSFPRLEHLELNSSGIPASFKPEMFNLHSLSIKNMNLYRILSPLPSLRRCEVENCDLLERIGLNEEKLFFCRIVNSYTQSRLFDQDGKRLKVKEKETEVIAQH